MGKRGGGKKREGRRERERERRERERERERDEVQRLTDSERVK